jgi:multiple sugar transport system substrate-binding protein
MKRSLLILAFTVGLVLPAAAQAEQVTVFSAETGINVDYRVYRSEDLADILPAQFGAERTIGDVIFMWEWWIAQNAQHIVELGDVVEGVPLIAEPVRVNGEVYGAPYVLSVKPGFWYRQSFFETHGLTPPTSWDEFVALLDALQAIEGVRNAIASGNGVGWPLSDITEHFLIAFGGPELQWALIEGTVNWQDDAVRSIFDERLVPLLAAGYFSDPIEWTSALDLWWRGDYGLYFMGNWITGMVEDPEDLGVFTLPGAEAVVGVPDYAFIPRYSENVDAAKALLSFMLSREGIELRVAEGGKLSVREDVGVEAYPPAEQALAAALEGLITVPDLDDTIGGGWQQVFWDQLKLLWVAPDALDDVLLELDEAR